jgi:hypothetical protein
VCQRSDTPRSVSVQASKHDRYRQTPQDPETIKHLNRASGRTNEEQLDPLAITGQTVGAERSPGLQVRTRNLHHVRELMDEVFGRENFVAVINFKTMMPLESGQIESVTDYICWYARDKERLKYRNLFVRKNVGTGSEFVFADTVDGDYRRLTQEEVEDFESTAAEHSVFKRSDLASSGYTPSCVFPIDFDGQRFETKRGKSWRTTPAGISELIRKKRLFTLGKKLYFKMYVRDFGYGSLINQWTDTIEFGGRSYVVQTTPTVIERCMLMTSDPGDLVLDTTCGSGTTAYVAEQWGRRWITCDTSRVPLALARQRLSTRTKAALAAAKARGIKLGGYRWDIQTVASKGNAASAEVRAEKASKHARDLMPLIQRIQAEGATSLRQIASELNERKIPTARGGDWSAVQVQRLVQRG